MRSFRGHTSTHQIRVPDLVGLPSAEAQAIGAGLGFQVTGPEGAVLSTAGVVVAQSPDPGVSTRGGSQLELWVQRGRGHYDDRDPLGPPPAERYERVDADERIRLREPVGVR